MTETGMFFLLNKDIVNELDWHREKKASLFRSIGYLCNDQQFWKSEDIFSSFDGLIYIKNSNAAIGL